MRCPLLAPSRPANKKKRRKVARCAVSSMRGAAKGQDRPGSLSPEGRKHKHSLRRPRPGRRKNVLDCRTHTLSRLRLRAVGGDHMVRGNRNRTQRQPPSTKPRVRVSVDASSDVGAMLKRTRGRQVPSRAGPRFQVQVWFPKYCRCKSHH